MIILDIEQQSTEWFKVKAGMPSASDFDKIITSTGSPSKQQQKYIYQLAGEKITGIRAESYQSLAMQRGIELEGEARQLYAFINDVEVKQVGFCLSDDKSCACSPDGLVGDDGGLEIKCPTLPVQVEYLLQNELPVDYYQQVQGCLYVTGRKWWDFMSYYPSLKPLIIRVLPDKDFHRALKIELELFNERLKNIEEKIK